MTNGTVASDHHYLIQKSLLIDLGVGACAVPMRKVHRVVDGHSVALRNGMVKGGFRSAGIGRFAALAGANLRWSQPTPGRRV